MFPSIVIKFPVIIQHGYRMVHWFDELSLAHAPLKPQGNW